MQSLLARFWGFSEISWFPKIKESTIYFVSGCGWAAYKNMLKTCCIADICVRTTTYLKMTSLS